VTVVLQPMIGSLLIRVLRKGKIGGTHRLGDDKCSGHCCDSQAENRSGLPLLPAQVLLSGVY
jgi:hypothetical protein